MCVESTDSFNSQLSWLNLLRALLESTIKKPPVLYGDSGRGPDCSVKFLGLPWPHHADVTKPRLSRQRRLPRRRFGVAWDKADPATERCRFVDRRLDKMREACDATRPEVYLAPIFSPSRLGSPRERYVKPCVTPEEADIIHPASFPFGRPRYDARNQCQKRSLCNSEGFWLPVGSRMWSFRSHSNLVGSPANLSLGFSFAYYIL